MNEDRFTASLLACVACGIIAGAMFRLPPVIFANDASRWNTVWSLNAGKGYVIDEAPYYTNDKVLRAGHYYSSKPALMPTAVAGLAWLLKGAAGLVLPRDQADIVRIVLILINVLPFGVMVALYARLLERSGYGLPARRFCVAVAAFGTYLTSYSVTLNNHTQAAWAAFFALCCSIRIHGDGRRRWRYFFFAGLFAAWAAANEAPALLFVAILLAILLRCDPKRALLGFLPPALAVAAAYFYTTYLATGRLRPYSISFDSQFYLFPGSYWLSPIGIDAMHEPKWLYVFHMVLGHHGVFSLTPVFVFSFCGVFLKDKLQLINRMGLFLTLYLLVLYALTTNNYGGQCQGLRWLFWLIPFWLISLAPAVEQGFRSRLFRVLAFAALLISVVSVGFALSGGGDIGPWGASWLYQFYRSIRWAP